MAGRFITLEGGEGSGKSTQAKRLGAALEAKGHAVLVTREPGGSLGAEEIRGLLVNGAPGRWDALTETLLVYAARADHVGRTIGPALLADRWVICDRFTDSTYAYQ
ncbi:MAG TPA: dTMP kinase, partial [Rhizomicrobium sp.]|nr:dTMP kinase [Rhizomicrobium sp.]